MIFETLKGKRVGYLNLDMCARLYATRYDFEERAENPFLDPMTCEKFIAETHKRHAVDWSYGGWGEDRRFLWRGSYLEPEKKFFHLGVDFNAPVGTPVYLDLPARVLRIDDDTPLAGGWGTSIALELLDEPVVLLYGHLGPKVHCEVGQVLPPKTQIGLLGRPEHNGGWFSHTHVQAIWREAFPMFNENWETLDGYAAEKHLPRAMKLFVDPMPYVRIS